MENFSYLIAWVLYLMAATGLTIVFWRVTAGMRLRRTRRALRSLVAVVLFTPINTAEQGIWLVPAYLVGAYDWVLDNSERALEAGLYLSAAYCLLIFVIFLESILRRLFDMGPRP